MERPFRLQTNGGDGHFPCFLASGKIVRRATLVDREGVAECLKKEKTIRRGDR
jgi:hypothetical protein